MNKIKAGVVVVTEFCRPGEDKFQGYIDYINRSEAVRNQNTEKYNLYQEYMGNPQKTTGLFTAEKDMLTKKEKDELQAVFTKAQENESIMWQTVISFDNRWLKQNGIINEDNTLIDEGKLREVARGGVRRMLEAEGLENAVWSGAIHFNTDNLHIHIATVEPVPMREQKEYVQYNYRYENGKRIKEPVLDDEGRPITKKEYKGRFKQSSISKCKSYVVNELVNDKENNIKINNIIRESIVRQKKEHPLSNDKDFAKAFELLHSLMPNVSKNLWNYNNPIMAGLREKIDNLSDMYIEKYHSEEYKELLERIATQEEVYKTAYGHSDKDYAKNKLQDLYTRMGNQILKEIKNYDREMNEADIVETTDFSIEEPEIIEEENNNKFDENIEEIIPEDNTESIIDNFIEPEADIESSYYKWSDKYKKAKKLIHKKNPDYEAAIKLLIDEHGKGNVLATYELGDIYKYGRGRMISAETAEKYYARALEGFEYQLDNPETSYNMTPETLDRKINYLNYRIGKMYYYGLGTETDYSRAFNLFASAEENQYAKYMLAKMKYYGQGTEKNWDGAFTDLVSIAQENAYASYKAATMIEKGEIKEEISNGLVKEDLYNHAFNGFMRMETKQEDDNLEYRIGMMYLDGKGVKENKEVAINYLEKSAEAKNIFAMNKLAEIYLGENNQDKIPKAMDYLYEAATRGNNAMAMYTLGNVYSSNDYGMKNQEEAIRWYLKAEEKGNVVASYKLGKMYMLDKKMGQAIEHFEKCENKYASYNLGKIYLDGTLEQYYNPIKGMEYMEKAAEEGNVFAQYRVGKEYFKGEMVEQNINKAVYYLDKSSKQDNEFASYILGKIYLDKNEHENAENEFLKCTNENIKAYSEYYLGKIYLDKEGKCFNPQKGIAYMEQSVRDGNSTAAFALGITYIKGESVKKNKVLGMSWIERAAEDGNEYARNFLANRTERSNEYSHKKFNAGITQAMILSNATQFLKKALKDEWQRRQNLKEHEMLRQEGEELE